MNQVYRTSLLLTLVAVTGISCAEEDSGSPAGIQADAQARKPESTEARHSPTSQPTTQAKSQPASSPFATTPEQIAQRALRPALTADKVMKRLEGLPPEALDRLHQVLIVDAIQARFVLARQQEFWDDDDKFDAAAFAEFIECAQVGKGKASWGTAVHNLRDLYPISWPWKSSNM